MRRQSSSATSTPPHPKQVQRGAGGLMLRLYMDVRVKAATTADVITPTHPACRSRRTRAGCQGVLSPRASTSTALFGGRLPFRGSQNRAPRYNPGMTCVWRSNSRPPTRTFSPREVKLRRNSAVTAIRSVTVYSSPVPTGIKNEVYVSETPLSVSSMLAPAKPIPPWTTTLTKSRVPGMSHQNLAWADSPNT